MSQFKITGALANPSTVTGAIYANQNNENVTDAQDNEILYYENGAPASSALLTFDGGLLTVEAGTQITGNVDITGITEFTGAIGQEGGDVNLGAAGPNPATSAAVGPRLLFRNNLMPMYWTTTLIVTSQNVNGFIAGGAGSTAIDGRNYWNIDGPYQSSSLTTQVVGTNGNPGANRDFYVLGVNLYTSTYDDIPTNGKIGSCTILAKGLNTNPARVNIGILFVPPIAA